MGTFGSYSGDYDLRRMMDTFRGAGRRPAPRSASGTMGERTIAGAWIGPDRFAPPPAPYGGLTRMSGPQWEGLLADSLLRDADAFQGAADRQYDRNQGQIGAYENALGGNIAGIQAGGQTALGQADQAMGDLQGSQDMALQNLLSSAQALEGAIPGIMEYVRGPINQAMGAAGQMQQGAQDFLGNIPDLAGDAMAGYQRGEQEYGAYQGAINEFKAESWADAEALASGIRSSMADQEALATSTFNPDGTPKTAAQMASDRYMFGRMAQEQTSQVMSQYAGRIRDGVASMRGNLANIGIQVAGMRGKVADAKNQEAILRISGLQTLGKAAEIMNQSGQLAGQAGALEGDLYSRVAAITSEAESNRLQYQQLRNGWHQFKSSILSSLPVTTANLEMQGRKDIAALVQQNPETVISWFESLLGLYSAMSAASGTTGFGGGGGGGGNKPQENQQGNNGARGAQASLGIGGAPMGSGMGRNNFQGVSNSFGQGSYTNGPAGAGQTQMPDYGNTGMRNA